VQYELRTQVIEPKRKTFDNLVARYGDRPASRYQEGSIDIQATENFHFRPLWAPDKEIYDEAFSVLRLTDPYSFLDPRQYYYAPYVTSRAAMFDAFSATLDYLEERGMFDRLPERWSELFQTVVLPLRHYESAAQMVSCDTARFGMGTTITQCAAYAAFDRVGNAQLISRVGISLGGGSADLLDVAKTSWLQDASLQPLRRLAEELLVERDWGRSLVALDVADQLLYPLLFTHLDEVALNGGAGSYSLIAQHLSKWFKDQRRWLDALYRAWTSDPELGETNKVLLAEIVEKALASAQVATSSVAVRADQLVATGSLTAVDESAATIREFFRALGVPVKESRS
jgi:phenol/toluene 2-monooxygenase (NADH) P1/A1